MKKVLLLVLLLIAAGMTWAFVEGLLLLLRSAASPGGKLAGSAMFLAMTCFTAVIVIHGFFAARELPGSTKPAFEQNWRKYAVYSWLAALGCMLVFIMLEFVVHHKS